MTMRILVAALVAAAAPAAAAPPSVQPAPGGGPHRGDSQVTVMGPHGTTVRAYRCGTPSPSHIEMAAVEGVLAHFRSSVRGQGHIEVPVAYHVIYTLGDDGLPFGIPPAEQLQAQIDVLNEAYPGFTFSVASIDYTLQTAEEPWFDKCFQQGTRMKRALAIDPATTLNVYTCEPYWGRDLLLGYSTFPWSYPEDDPRHGVVVLHSSLPGGSAVPYDLGDTATHEIGHYLGLYHTFQDGCTEPGDMVEDTPYEASPAFGCPDGRDTCPQPGEDPIHNFMDYTDDLCMDHFTAEQADRLLAMTEAFRPTLATLSLQY